MSLGPRRMAEVWQDVSDPRNWSRYFIGGIETPDMATPYAAHDPKVYYLEKKAKFYLGECFPETYFTCREAEVMYLIMQGYTNYQAGEVLGLSARTVEYYIRNMREKVNCNSKAELIEIINQTNFYDTLK